MTEQIKRTLTRQVGQDEEFDVLCRMQVDTEIVIAVAAHRDPLDLKPLRRHLISYGAFWISGEPAARENIPCCCARGGGCMVCGSSPVRLFVMTLAGAGVLPANSGVWHTLRSQADYTAPTAGESWNVGWLPLIDIWQALWRLTPESYFAHVSLLPLLHLPLLLLCDACASLVGQTHREIESGGGRI